MAIITRCVKCGKDFSHSVRDAQLRCPECRNEPKVKSWEEMTIDEKLNYLKNKIDRVSRYNEPIG